MPIIGAAIIADAFAANFLAAPSVCFFILNASLTPEQLRAAVARIEAGQLNPQMPEYLAGFARTAGFATGEGE